MELLTTTPKSKYLLDAGLEVLHEQSNEWLNEIAFWRDETAFLYSLMVKKTLSAVPVSAKNSINKIETELTTITGGELDTLQKSVEEHEHFLSYLLYNKSVNEKNYRSKHQELSIKFELFEKRLRSLKKEIFNLVKLIDKTLKVAINN